MGLSCRERLRVSFDCPCGLEKYGWERRREGGSSRPQHPLRPVKTAAQSRYRTPLVGRDSTAALLGGRCCYTPLPAPCMPRWRLRLCLKRVLQEPAREERPWPEPARSARRFLPSACLLVTITGPCRKARRSSSPRPPAHFGSTGQREWPEAARIEALLARRCSGPSLHIVQAHVSMLCTVLSSHRRFTCSSL